MRKLLLSAAMTAAISLPMSVSAQTAPAAAPAAAPTPDHTFTANTMLATDYRFRGVSQTFKQPAIQGGFDYSHSSGIYLGTWASNVSSNYYTNGSLEWDFYGGYKFEPAKDWTIDLGAIYYYYPAARSVTAVAAGTPAGLVTQTAKYNNFELYAGATYSYFSAKVFRSVSDYFGLNTTQIAGNGGLATVTAPGICGISATGAAATTNCYGSPPGGSKGSTYVDLAFNYPFGDKWTFGTHYGKTSVKNYSNHSYADWKIGLTKELNGFVFGLNYITTNAKKEWYRNTTANFVAPPGAAAAGQDMKALGEGTVVFSVSKTF